MNSEVGGNIHMNQSFNTKDTFEKLKETLNTPLIRMPKNLRQIGNIANSNRIIYIEDYVMTYIRQLSNKGSANCRIAILLGYTIAMEGNKNIFIKGAVEMNQVDFGKSSVFSNEDWTSIYESIKQYFSELEIVGWALIGPEFYIESVEKVRKTHIENFSGADKVLLKLDSMEKEENFYLVESNRLVKQSGYYIYYEKNEEMQNYMIENKEETILEEQVYIDKTTPKIRSILEEKKEKKEDKSIIRLLYSASTLLAIIVLVIAATMLYNYDQMKELELAVNSISQNISQVTQNTTQDANSIQDDLTTKNPVETQNKETKVEEVVTQEEINSVKENETSDSLEETEKDKLEETENNTDNEVAQKDDDSLIEVETVSGNVSAEDSSSSQVEEAKEDEKSSEEKNQPETQPVIAETKYYVVEPGDSLVGICLELYHSSNNLKKIMELNEIDDENKIYAGQKLIIP